jgi:hypothetical protein
MQAPLTFLRIWPDEKHDIPFAMLEAQRQWEQVFKASKKELQASWSGSGVYFWAVSVDSGADLRVDFQAVELGGFLRVDRSGSSVLLLYHVAWANMSGCGSSSWIT